MKMHARLSRTIAMILSAATASVIGPASPAIAQEDYDVVVRGVTEGSRMRLVTYRDLNLNLIAHRKILDQRVGNAVREVCSVGAGNRQSPDYRACSNQAWDGVKPQIVRAYVRAAQLAYGRR